MIAVVRCGAILALLVLSVACSDPPLPSAPTPVPSPVVPAPPPPALTVPPLEGPANLYVFSHPLEHPVQDYTTNSTYLLYETGAFALQYRRSRARSWARTSGKRTGSSSVLRRYPVGCLGTINGDSLEVRYNDIMVHSDFENAVYTRAQ